MIPIAQILAPKQIVWGNDRVQFEESYFSQSVEIRYSDMVAAYPVTFDRKKGGWKKLSVSEIGDDVPGYVVIYDRWHSVYEIRLMHMPLTAGEFLIDLAWHSGQTYIGYDDWIASMLDEKNFEELVHMVSVMAES